MAPTAAAVARAMTPISRSRAAAFTLLELLLVLGIIALAAALVAPNLGGVSARSFSAQLREAGAQLNAARRNAVISGQTTVISLQGAQRESLQTESARPGSAQTESTNPSAPNSTTWRSATAALAFSPNAVDPEDYAFRDRDFEPVPEVKISFYPEGGSSGGNILFAQNNDRAWAIIDPLTGRVTVTTEEASR